ncbi:ATP-binding protein [Longimicrobium sp.]|jgi:PAS domain S-box-containing protein|uniref:ATP-binding protein n=1 Tax=Longimicrobium sp. TaxID=2029185 RepID=UPI002ED9040F
MFPQKPADEQSRDAGGGSARGGGASSGIAGSETREREAARRRAELRAHASAEPAAPFSDPASDTTGMGVVHQAFSALAENVRDYGIFLMDPDGCITFWGEGARLLKGWTKADAEGAHLRLLYPDGGAEDGGAEEHLRTAAESGEYQGEGNRVRSDGSTFWAGVTLTALRDTDGTLLGFAKLTRDLTARRATEAARKAALEAAEEAARVKSHFIATMSHEIRTPLNAVMGYADLLAMELGGPLTRAHHEQIAKIRASSQHLLGMVDDVLDLARIESGRMAAARARLRLGSVVSRAMVLVEPQASAHGVELVSAMSGFVSEQHCWGDGERVRQILLNLLNNAVKFTERGGRITIGAEAAAEAPAYTRLEGPGPWIYIRVEDTGRGIPPGRLEAIFEPFVQAETGFTRRFGGAGLGLDISRRLARLMGGDLTVRSEPGVGSAFFLWLPAAANEEADSGPCTGDDDGVGVFAAIRAAVLSELERILHVYVARLRSDPGTPHARRLSEAELEDHLASFLSDLAQTMGTTHLAPQPGMRREETVIQRVISERHGLQRARLGWTEEEIRREFQVLREELAAAVRRRVHPCGEAELETAIGVLTEAVTHAEGLSVESYRGAAAE